RSGFRAADTHVADGDEPAWHRSGFRAADTHVADGDEPAWHRSGFRAADTHVADRRPRRAAAHDPFRPLTRPPPVSYFCHQLSRNWGRWLDIDWLMALSGLGVGFVVGLTGMGGGALMTPILVLLFNVPPLQAVSSDIVASMVMKPIGGGVHLK